MDQSDHTVTEICKRTVVGTKPVKPGKFHKFTPLDKLTESHHHRIVYYYKTPTGLDSLQLRMKLIESITETLTHYPMTMGRPVKDESSSTGEWMIKCNDAGVRMVEAKAKGSVESWVQNLSHEMELKLVYWEDTYYNPYYWAIVYVQVTQFEEGGLALGFSSIHALVDQISASIFMKAWGSTTLTGKIVSPPLFHSLFPLRRSTISETSSIDRPNSYLIDHYKSVLDKQGPFVARDCKTITFLFSESMVQSCITAAQIPSSHNLLSPFEALSGMFWAAISRVKGKQAHNHDTGLVDMSICLDARKLLGLDTCFFGNCMIYAKVETNNEDGLTTTAANATPPLAARAISDAIKGLVRTESVHDLIEWLETTSVSRGDGLSITTSVPSMENGGGITCVNLEHMDLYSADFDPNYELVRVSYHVEPVFGEGRVVVLPSVPGEDEGRRLSRVVKVSLPGDEIDKLCEDGFISSLSPTVLVTAD